MANPSVIEGILELPSGKVIEVGSTSWTKWLESESVKAFRFEGYAGTFTARKERPQKGSPYWSASRRLDGKLRKTYLAGSSEAITVSRLEEVAEYLASPQYATKVRKSATADKVAYHAEIPEGTDAVSQLQKQVAELSMQLRLLQSDLPALIQSQVLQMQSPVTAGDNRSGESDRLEESEAFRQELEAALGEIAALKAENHELKSQLATQQEKVVIYEDGEPVEISGGLASWALREAEVKIANALDEVAELKKENEKLRSRIASQPAAAPDYTAIKDRALASLKLGKQAPGYKAAAKAIDKFIEFIQGQ